MSKADDLFERLYVCHDPDCTATHVDMTNISPVTFEEILMILCPECQQGKHRNCDGRAWDFHQDEVTQCTCPDPSHDTVPL